MNTQTNSASGFIKPAIAKKALDLSAKTWFGVTLLGQAIFSIYIIAVYYTATFTANTEKFNIVMPHGYIQDDLWGNIAVIAHVLMAAVITFGGTMQLIPWLRTKFSSFHRWNGRLYIITAFLMSLSGTFMVLTRGTIGDNFAAISILINGLIIMVCAALAFKHARNKKFTDHRRWALRLFVAVSGVWFFRIGLMLWLVINGKPVGFDPATFTGPFLTSLQFIVYILPVTLMEIYLRASATGSPAMRFNVAMGLFILTALMALGIFGATMGMWLPRI